MNAIPSRPRFNSFQDWHNFVPQLIADEHALLRMNQLRRACYDDIEKLRGRPLLIYAAQIPPPHQVAPTLIDHGDIDGFADLVTSVDSNLDGVDVLVHSLGGNPEATERIVSILRGRFKNITFLIPHSAFSAATMLALSGDQIILHLVASLGPIDPQINGIPARSIRRGFEKVRELLKEQGPEALPAYLPLIEKHSLELLEMCEDSLRLSQELVSEWLFRYMFREDTEKRELINKAVDFFSDYDTHKTHGRPLTFEKVKGLGLNITMAEPALARLLREVHILLTGFFTSTPFVKIYENSHDLSYGQQFEIQAMPIKPSPAQQGPPTKE